MGGKGTISLLVVVLVVVIRHGDVFVEARISQAAPPEASGALASQRPPVSAIAFPDAASAAAASLGTCQASGTLVDVCIDSGMSIFSSGYIPAAPHGAVGPETLIAVTNVVIESVHKNDGSVVFGPIDLSEMFSSLDPDQLTSPRIVYDVHQSRFVLVLLEETVDFFFGDVLVSRILVAVSKTPVPTSASSSDWFFLEIDALVDEQYFADYPGLAFDEEAIYITCNMYLAFFPFSFEKSLLWIIAKDPLYSGGTAAVNRYDYILLSGGGIYGSHMPAMVRSSAGVAPGVGTYLVQYDGIFYESDGTELVSIIQIDSPLSSPTFLQAFVTLGNVDSLGFGVLPAAPQKGTNARVDVGDQRVLDAVWVNNQLWVVATAKDPAGQTAALWVKLNADGVTLPTLADKGLIRGEEIAPGTFTFFPSLDVNSDWVAAFGFAASAGSIYPSAYAAIRDDVVDPAGKVRPAMLVKAGEAPYYITFGSGRNRWGGYSGMALDPSNEDCFWAFNEYAASATYDSDDGQFGSWKTAWARLCYNVTTTPPPTPPPTKAPCKRRNQVCTRKSQCCPPLNNKACDGPRGVPKTCKACLRKGAPCDRTQQCCAGLKCKSRKCQA